MQQIGRPRTAVPHSASLVDQLLARCPEVRVLTTSREPLGIVGEALCLLPPLGLPPVGVAARDAADHPSVQLLVERAQAVHAGFAVDDSTVDDITEIVQRLDGLPLAIELAAARLRVMPIGEIAARLSDRFRLLTGGSRTAMPRHRTLRAVVEWSWDLLAPDERLLAERLAVFPAGATVDSACAVCGDDRLPVADIGELLLSLVDKSLLTTIDASPVRYRMLETIREYGTEQLEAEARGLLAVVTPPEMVCRQRLPERDLPAGAELRWVNDDAGIADFVAVNAAAYGSLGMPRRGHARR